MNAIARLLGFSSPTKFCRIHKGVVMAPLSFAGTKNYCCPVCASEQ